MVKVKNCYSVFCCYCLSESVLPRVKATGQQIIYARDSKRKTDGRVDADVAVRKRCNSVVKPAGGTSNMSTHMKCHHPLLLPGSPVGYKRKADTLVRIVYRYFTPV